MAMKVNNFKARGISTLTREHFPKFLKITQRGQSLMMVKKQQNFRKKYGLPVLNKSNLLNGLTEVERR